MADENGRFPEAAAAYEAALLSDPTDLEATLNLAVLYWQAMAHERHSPGMLSPQFLEHAQWRLAAILLHAGRRFAGRAEIRFWTNYIAALESGRPLRPAVCRELLRERPDYFEPAFVVFCASAGEEAEPEAMRLLAHYSEQPTARGRYVTAIISAALSRQRWRRPRAANSPVVASASPKASRPRLTSVHA